MHFRKKYSGFVCDYLYAGLKIHEIRWDVMNCNLKCKFCWSPASRPLETHEGGIIINTHDCAQKTIHTINTMQESHNPNVFIRFTGGEPMLYWDELRDVFNIFENNLVTKDIPILIQTNGILISEKKLDLEFLHQTNLKILFELSFKGTNDKEFELLTNRTKDNFHHQVKAFNTLYAISEINKNIKVVAVHGIYHSSVKAKSSKYVFINPNDKNILFDDKTLWDKNFDTIWSSTKLKWVEPLRMSPMGVFRNLQRRCSEILLHDSNGIPTNVYGLFPGKPKSDQYAYNIVSYQYWGL